jgi:hypothetical protein
MAEPKPQPQVRLLTQDEADKLLVKAKAKPSPAKARKGRQPLREDWEVVPVSHEPLDEAVLEELKVRRKLSVALKRGTKKDQVKVCREWWRTMETLLERTARAFPQSKGALIKLSQLAGYLAVGAIPAPIELARSWGQREPGPTERRHIGWGVAYLKAAEDGRINDPHPTKTISDRYRVTRKTVQNWKAKIESPRDSENLSGDQIREEMELAARAYPGPSKKAMARYEPE